MWIKQLFCKHKFKEGKFVIIKAEPFYSDYDGLQVLQKCKCNKCGEERKLIIFSPKARALVKIYLEHVEKENKKYDILVEKEYKKIKSSPSTSKVTKC